MEPNGEVVEVEDQVVVLKNETMGSVDDVMAQNDKAMELEDQVMILKSKAIMLLNNSVGSMDEIMDGRVSGQSFLPKKMDQRMVWSYSEKAVNLGKFQKYLF